MIFFRPTLTPGCALGFRVHIFFLSFKNHFWANLKRKKVTIASDHANTNEKKSAIGKLLALIELHFCEFDLLENSIFDFQFSRFVLQSCLSYDFIRAKKGILTEELNSVPFAHFKTVFERLKR